MNALRETLLDDKQFVEVAQYFVEKIEFDDDDNLQFNQFYKAATEALVAENAAAVADLSESPIEKIFLNSLILGAIKGDNLLSVHRTYKDTAAEIEQFQRDLSSFKDFVAWFSTNKPTATMHEFFDLEVERGNMHPDERSFLTRLVFKYHYLPLENSLHMTIQSRFPSIKVEKRSIRPDIYFWIPSKPHIKIIVECDGFAYHSDKFHFTDDRRRDRILTSLGYEVLRFSGSEIYRDPVRVSSELALHLVKRAEIERQAR